MKTAIEIMQDDLTYLYSEIEHLVDKKRNKELELRFLGAHDAHLQKVIKDRIQDIDDSCDKVKQRIHDRELALHFLATGVV